MQKNLTVIAIAVAASAVYAQESKVSISGTVDVAVRSVHNSEGTVKSVVSGSNSTSKLILRGTEDLGGGLKAGFWLEGTYLVGVAVPMGPHEVKASYVRADQKGKDATGASIDANDAQQFALSYDYSLSKRSAVYANLAYLKNEGAATFAITGGPGNRTAVSRSVFAMPSDGLRSPPDLSANLRSYG